MVTDDGLAHLEINKAWLHDKTSIKDVETSAGKLFKIGEGFAVKNACGLAFQVVKIWIRSDAPIGRGTAKILQAKQLFPYCGVRLGCPLLDVLGTRWHPL